MTLQKRRARLVAFRLSEREFEQLGNACSASDSRSISEFARAAILDRISADHAPQGLLTRDLTSLSRSLVELDAALADIRRQIRRVLGGQPSPTLSAKAQGGT